MNKNSIMNQDCIQLIFFEYLIKIEVDCFTNEMFYLLHDLILHLNL
jgi:hypothetical protein